MQFKQYKDGSCDIKFSWKEVWIIIKKRKLHLTAEGLRHFGNMLMKIVMEWNLEFDDKVSNLETRNTTQIKGTIKGDTSSK